MCDGEVQSNLNPNPNPNPPVTTIQTVAESLCMKISSSSVADDAFTGETEPYWISRLSDV